MNKYLTPALLPAFLVSLFLQGCGSSSDSPEEPVEPTVYTFTLTAQLPNECGVDSAFTEIELLLQDDTWQTLSSYKADENGVITFLTESEFINYTIIAKDQKESEAEGLNVASYYQASTATPAYYQAQFDELQDNSTCECVTQNVELNHAIFETQTSVTSSLSFDDWQAIDESKTLFENIKVCRAIGSDWKPQSFSVSGTANDIAVASAAFSADFDETDSGIWSISAFAVGAINDLSLPHQEFTTSQLVANNSHFIETILEDEESLLVFDNHDYTTEAFYQSKASVTFAEESSKFGSVVIKTHHQIISTDKEESFSVKADERKPVIDDQYFSEIGEDSVYDYSNVANYPMSVINFTYTAFDPETKLVIPAKWTFYGPIKGVLADSGTLTGYEDILNLKTSIKVTETHLIKSAAATTYNDYIQYFQAGNTVDINLDASHEFLRGIEIVEVSISLN